MPAYNDFLKNSEDRDEAKSGVQVIGGQVSKATNIHDAGSDANDTSDGLTESEEAVRKAAEDIPAGQSPTGEVDTVPVFDRGSLPPKV